MKAINIKKIQNTAILFILFAPIAVIYYAFYIFNINNAGNIYLYILQIIADGIAFIVIGTLWITIALDLIRPEHHTRDIIYSKNYVLSEKPTVDILIPTFNEPYEIVKHTIESTMSLDYPHTLYILDDGDSNEIAALAFQKGITYISRLSHNKKYAKSGNLNNALKQCKGDFFAVFDADHAPKKNFLSELLPFFENENVALVQSPQHFSNTKNFIASGTSQAQEIFYTYIQPAKNSYNASFCVGTNMIYRRSAINEIGGIVSTDHSEDIWTTLKLHEKGYESVFYNKILAVGRAPESIESFFRQQNRWAQGGFTLFFTNNALFIQKLSLDQKLQYFFSNIHYFSGFSILIYLFLPIIYLLFGLHSMKLSQSQQWLSHYLPYFIVVYFLPVFLLGKLKLATIATSVASFAPYIGAFFSVVLNTNYTWISTESSRKKNTIIMWQIWPHTFIIMLSILSLVVGWYNPNDVWTTFIISCWVLLNTYFLSIFIKNGLIAQKSV